MRTSRVGGTAPDGLCPELRSLLSLWHSRYGGRSLPERSLFAVDELQRWSRNLAQIEHGTDGRFYVRTFGIDLIRRFGREATGHCIDALARDIRESLHDSLWRCFSTGTPVAAWSSVKLGRDAAEFRELVLPLAPASLLLASYERSAAD